ncbi:hypothetical protein KVF89_20860 [Nocardioides carbamazepini]|uniref:hypothetical protein n=1 Tax=Nocardioides carbamazepini TaxID=2854259 RepID=UPI00214A50F0|nr:hypothetical protein [Nocardioides carbamazepini]MCR1785003.1 hypothetical protein [Nocardioides carbamazepini]
MNETDQFLSPLLDPLAALRAQNAEFPWERHGALEFDERYRTRQLPLLRDEERPPIGPTDIAPGEFWPPVRSVVLPLPADLLQHSHIRVFLDDLKRADVAPLIWFQGLRLRAERMHATLVPGIGDGHLADLPPAPAEGVGIVVRGPWVGRYNRGRIYFPVQAADTTSALWLATLGRRWGVEIGPLLSGILQLRGAVCGAAYDQLREIVRAHQARVAVPVRVTEYRVVDTMDDLVLRSQVVDRIEVTAG